MSKRNPLRNSTRKNTNYKLYKAKKQWVTACATFLLTFGATAVFNSTNAQTVNNNKRSNNEIEEVTSAAGSSSTNGAVELSATSAADQSGTASVTSQADANSSNSSVDTENNAASTTDEASSAADAHHTDTAVTFPVDSSAQSDESADGSAATADASASDATDASSSSTEESNNGDATTTLKTNANGTTDVNPDALKESKINTTDTTVTWSNHRYIIDWDGQAHPASYWNDRIKNEVLPWILKENNNEGATFKSMTWTDWMTKDGDNYSPIMNEAKGTVNAFGYPHGDLVVTNANGTSTTTYKDVIINMATNIAAYFKGKYGLNSSDTPVEGENAQNTVINVHANSNSFTGIIPNSSIGTITVSGWTYGQTGDSADDSRDYLLSLIKQVKLTDADLSKDGTQNTGKLEITFTDNSVLTVNKATINVVGGVAQSGLTVGKGGNIAFAYPNATSGITTDSQNKIAQWTPTYDWVYDANGTPLDASHQYNTNANFDAYVKITYHLNGKNDGS